MTAVTLTESDIQDLEDLTEKFASQQRDKTCRMIAQKIRRLHSGMIASIVFNEEELVAIVKALLDDGSAESLLFAIKMTETLKQRIAAKIRSDQKDAEVIGQQVNDLLEGGLS